MSTVKRVHEGGSAFFDVVFMDEASPPANVSAKTAKYSVADAAGTAVAGQTDVNIPTPGSSTTIVLKDTNVVRVGTEEEELQYLIVEYTYDNATLTDIPAVKKFPFYVVAVNKS